MRVEFLTHIAKEAWRGNARLPSLPTSLFHAPFDVLLKSFDVLQFPDTSSSPILFSCAQIRARVIYPRCASTIVRF